MQGVAPSAEERHQEGGLECATNWTALLILLTCGGVKSYQCGKRYYRAYQKEGRERATLREIVLCPERLSNLDIYENSVREIFYLEVDSLKEWSRLKNEYNEIGFTYRTDFQKNAEKRYKYMAHLHERPLYTKELVDEFFSSPRANRKDWIQIKEGSYINIFTRESLTQDRCRWIYKNFKTDKSEVSIEDFNGWGWDPVYTLEEAQ